MSIRRGEGMHSRSIVILLSCMILLALSGCSWLRGFSSPSAGNSRPGADVVLTGHTPVSLHNYRTARMYSAEGRLELAREHYLLAYAAAENDNELRAVLERELRAVDMMIKTLR